MSSIIGDITTEVQFQPDKMGKATLSRGKHLMVGLNCFEPGQAHASHSHGDSDKAYYVVSGSGTFTVGAETERLAPGALVFAPAGVPHGVTNDGTERLVLLVTLAPPPGRSDR